MSAFAVRLGSRFRFADLFWLYDHRKADSGDNRVDAFVRGAGGNFPERGSSNPAAFKIVRWATLSTRPSMIETGWKSSPSCSASRAVKGCASSVKVTIPSVWRVGERAGERLSTDLSDINQASGLSHEREDFGERRNCPIDQPEDPTQPGCGVNELKDGERRRRIDDRKQGQLVIHTVGPYRRGPAATA